MINLHEVLYWFCSYCDKRYLHEPDSAYCSPCEDENIRARIKAFTREDAEEQKSELQLDAFFENNVD